MHTRDRSTTRRSSPGIFQREISWKERTVLDRTRVNFNAKAKCFSNVSFPLSLALGLACTMERKKVSLGSR